MCACVGTNFGLSSWLKMEGEEAIIGKMQGIVSILVSDSDRSSTATSLRRTLSADMSSKKWLSQNGFLSPMKKIASSGEFSISETNSFSSTNSSSSEDEDEEGDGGDNESRSRFDIWASIQEEKNDNKESEKGGPFYVWSSIMCQKAGEDSAAKPLPPPYVHPLVRRSKSTLSGKSLEICTENLGSESGSDGFSSYPQSETGDGEEEEEESGSVQEQQEPLKQELIGWGQEEPVKIVKSGSLADKKPSQRSFPPPLSSFARQGGASTYMRSRRDNGRLVLEAVSVPSKNNFCAQRQGGRLVLTFAKANQEEDMGQERSEEMVQEKDMEEEEEIESSEEEEEMEGNKDKEETQEHDDEEEMGFVMEQVPKFSSGLMSVHRLASMVNKPVGLTNRNPTWPKNSNEITKLEDLEEENEEKNNQAMVLKKPKPKSPLAQSLPPRPPTARQILSSPPPTLATATVTCFNVYEPYWRLKSLNKNEQQEEVVLMRKNRQQGSGDELVVKGCKDQRRPPWFLRWEPYPIAT